MTVNLAAKDPKEVVLTDQRTAEQSPNDKDVTSPAERAKKRRRSASNVPTVATTTDQLSQVEEARTFLKDGKLVSSKDGRAAAAGNELRTQFLNNYRNHRKDRTFCGRALTLGEEHALFSAGMTSAYLFTHLAIIR